MKDNNKEAHNITIRAEDEPEATKDSNTIAQNNNTNDKLIAPR